MRSSARGERTFALGGWRLPLLGGWRLTLVTDFWPVFGAGEGTSAGGLVALGVGEGASAFGLVAKGVGEDTSASGWVGALGLGVWR